MSRNRRNAEPIRITGLSIIDIAEEGKGVGKSDELVIFVDKAVPGDVVDIRVVKKKKNFAEAIIENIETKSPSRVEPFCMHFGTCGGCKWQHMDYDAQLRYKQKNVEAALQRLAKVDTSVMEPILGSVANKYYRNKLEYTFSNKRWLNASDMQIEDESREMNALGFHVPGRFDKILSILLTKSISLKLLCCTISCNNCTSVSFNAFLLAMNSKYFSAFFNTSLSSNAISV